MRRIPTKKVPSTRTRKRAVARRANPATRHIATARIDWSLALRSINVEHIERLAGVVPLATAYSISEAFGFEKGVSSSFREAPIFLGIFTFLVALGALIAMMPGLPLIRVLIVTQVINGVLLPVILLAILRLVNNRELMGQHTNGPLYNLGAWLTAILVSALSILLIIVTLFPNTFPRSG